MMDGCLCVHTEMTASHQGTVTAEAEAAYVR